MGLCGSDWGELRFVDCVISEANRIGEEGKGFAIFMDSLDAGRVSIAAISLGIAEACYQASLNFIKQGMQQAPKNALSEEALLKLESDQVMLAQMKTRIEAARYMVLHTGLLKDSGKSYGFEASAAKVFASETCTLCAHEAVKLLGEYGYTKASPVERYLRDAKAMEIVEGTSQIQRLVIARTLLRHS
jgi:alkylation response protein AidB-like acyl-CoA dehydrogenase